MTARAHIRSGEIIRRYSGERGWFQLENGDSVSPPVIGYENGNDKIVAVETATVDNSTPGAETVSTGATTVEANRVLITTTIRDKTIQEITAERDAALAELDTQRRDLQMAVNLHVKEATAIMFMLAKQITPSLTLQQFANYWDNNKNAITLEQFKTYLRRNQS